MSNGKDKKIDSATALIKMSQHFPKPYKSLGGDISVKVDLPNYATKTDSKYVTGIDTSKSDLKTDLAS